MTSQPAPMLTDAHDQMILNRMIEKFQARVITIIHRPEGKDVTFFPKNSRAPLATFLGSEMVDFKKALAGEYRCQQDQSFDEFLASDPSEEFRSGGNSNQGKENTMIQLQRAQTPNETSAAPRGVQFLKPSHVSVVNGKIGEIKAKVYKVTT